MNPNEKQSVAILNGFGRTLGDGVIGLQALSVAIARGRIAPAPVPMLFRLPGLPPVLRQLYGLAGDLASVEELPWNAEKPGPLPEAAREFRSVIDLRDFAFDPAFRGTPMIDYFLARLGVDLAAVPAAEKRNSWLAPRMDPIPPREPAYVLVCPTAAMEMRCMPNAVHDRIVGWLTTHQNLPVLSQAILPPETTLAGLCALVAGAALIVGTDTAMVHLADAFSVPCLAFFPTHRPEWRVRDYPLCRAVHLPSRLPEAIEFARDEADIAEAKAAWFARGADLNWLEPILAGMFERRGVRKSQPRY